MGSVMKILSPERVVMAALIGAIVAWTTLAVGTALPTRYDPPRWAQKEAEHPVAEGSTVRETHWEMSRLGRPERIGLHRYRAEGTPVATLLYLPGTNMNGVSALTDEAHNLWIYLAARGIEVYAMDYRTHTVPSDADPASLTAMRYWSLATFIDDVALAAAKVRHQSGQDRLFVAGFSRGAMLAYAYAGREPDKLAGLIILDGSFKSASPEPFDLQQAMAAFEAAGKWANDIGGSRGYPARQALMDAVIANPDGPALDPKFKTMAEQLNYVLSRSWGPGGLANLSDGISKPEIVARLLRSYDRYYPAVQDIEGKQLAAEADVPRMPSDDAWGEMNVPILAFSSTNMGETWIANVEHSAKASGSSDVTVSRLERYGHLDVLIGEDAATRVFEPVLAWIKARN